MLLFLPFPYIAYKTAAKPGCDTGCPATPRVTFISMPFYRVTGVSDALPAPLLDKMLRLMSFPSVEQSLPPAL